MPKLNKAIKNVAFIIAVVVFSLTLTYAASAVWQEPSDIPPNANVDAPLNVGYDPQFKRGALVVNYGDNGIVGGSPIGLTVPLGNVGIGTTNPGAKLHILGISNVDTKADNIFVQGISDVASNNPAIEFRRSKGNSYPGNAVVFDDMLGEVIGEGYDGVSWPEAANILMSVDGPVAAGKVPARFDFLTRDNSGNYSSRMTIKNNGKVGIGTADPKAKMHIRFEDVGTSNLISNHPGDPLTKSAIGGNLALEGNDASLSFACSDDSLTCDSIMFKQFNMDAGKTFRNQWGIYTVASVSGDAMRFTFGRDSSMHHNDTLFSIVPQDPMAFPNNLGRVGINTYAPIADLDVTGSFSSSKLIQGGYYGYKSGTTITRTSGIAFTAADVGRYWGWGNGTTDKIVAYIDANRVTAATSSTVGSAVSAISGRISTVNFYINDSGNVGIGTTNPSTLLEVAGNSTYSEVLVNSPGSAAYGFKGGTMNARIYAGSGTTSGGIPTKRMRIVANNTAGVEKSIFYIDSQGAAATEYNVGVGEWWDNLSSSYKLSVNGNFFVTGQAYKPGGGSFAVPSDNRLKNVLGYFERGLSEVNRLNPVKYVYKTDNALGLSSEKEHVGLVAQDVQKIIPEAIEEIDGYLMLDEEPITWAMINAIKELKTENDALKARIEALENKLK